MKQITTTFLAIMMVITSFAQEANTDILGQNFKTPPSVAKPITWMHVMSGNMSKEGMTKDLEAIADAGIGGVLLFNVTHNIPNGPVGFNSPEDIAMKAFTAAECERLGLNFGIHNCDGWTSSGGPWVPVENSMMQVVHREVIVDGGEVDLFLPGPSKCGGFYKDIAVLAYPALDTEIKDAEANPIITASTSDFDVNIASNGKIDELSELRVEKDEQSWIQWDFGKAYTVRSFLLKSENQRTKNAVFTLEYSNDGKVFTKLKDLHINRLGKYFYNIDESFEGVTARYFRFVTNFALDVAEINLSAMYRYNDMTSRTSIYRRNNGGLSKLKHPGDDLIINRESVLNLTDKVDEKGQLKTSLPEGKWTLMRVGYTTTKAINDPASIGGTGYEVDKFSREAFKSFYDGYVSRVIGASKAISPNAMQWVEIDSYEVGSQNWTDGYEMLFNQALGYDIVNFLPLYAGRFVDDAETTERVLWDIRNFNSQLMTENYFDYFTELCHEDGMKSYVEPYGNAAFNTLDAARACDIPMGEFHASGKLMTDQAVSAGHIYGKNIISAEAFTSGSGDNFKGHPGKYKVTGDIAWSVGVNEICFHRFAHQANTNVTPGMTMSGFGSNIDRTQTWWENAGKEWFKYIARGQYLLRQGVPVADILAFVGDGSPNTTVSRRGLRDLPTSINYDCTNFDVLQNRISVVDGKLVLPEGTSYDALYLNNSREIHLSTLKRLGELADQGVIIIGNKPGSIGGFAPTEADKVAFAQLADEIWAKPTTVTDVNWEKIYNNFDLALDLVIKDGEDINYVHRKTATEDIYFFYNPKKEAHTYECTFNVEGKVPEFFDPMTGEVSPLGAFESINGQTKVAVPMTAEGSGFIVFRKSSEGLKSVKVFNALSQSDLAFSLDENNGLSVKGTKNGSYAVALSDGSKQQVELTNIPESITLEGDWDVTFTSTKSGDLNFTFPTLIDWTSHDREEVKYYSGTAIYSQTFKVSKKQLSPENNVKLDLGEVKEIARVILNGKDLGVLWKAPHTVDITSALVAGKNDLRIEVTNQWTNRMIGDENFPNLTGYDIRPQINKIHPARDPHLSLINRHKMVDWYINNEPAPLGERSTFCTYPFYDKGDQLLPAGLLGPVKINASQIVVK